MGFRFRRSVRIIPGVRLNFSKSGISTSIGARGATLNISKRGTRATVGIPGSGLSYHTGNLDRPHAPGAAPSSPGILSRLVRVVVALFALIVIGVLALAIFGPGK